MATRWDETRIFIPFWPSLLHCASAKIALQLYKEFGPQALAEAFKEIQQEKLTPSEEGRDKIPRAKDGLLHIPAHLRGAVMEDVQETDSEDFDEEFELENCIKEMQLGKLTPSKEVRDKIPMARDSLRHIPAHLRGRVIEAVHGMHRLIVNWKWFYGHFFKFKEAEDNFHFKVDGTIDTVKTARNLVENEKLDIKRRFELACIFCFAESAQDLWAQMEESGQAESVAMRDEDIISVWIGWLRQRPRVTSVQSFIQSLVTLILRSPRILYNPRTPVPRYSAILPLLRPEYRQNCLDLLSGACNSDFHLCLHAITKQEEEQLLKKGLAHMFLCAHLSWPFQTLFLETAEKLWDYIDATSFQGLLNTLREFNNMLKDFDYSYLFEGFWNASPLHLREKAREDPYYRERIDSFLMKCRRKRTSV